MRTFALTAVLGAAALLAHNAEAADNGIYLGGAVGQSTRDIETIDELFDEEDGAFKVIGGLRALDWLGLEANYFDLGTATQTRNAPDFAGFKLDQKGLGAYGVFFLDIAVFDLFGKAGLVRWDLEGSGAGIGGPVDVDDDGTDFAWGVGAQIRLRSLALRLEYERFELDAFDGLLEKPEFLSLGLTWTFL